MNLQQMRKYRGLSQEQLASKCYVVRQTIGNIEAGRMLPSLPLARQICKVLNCTWDIFFTEGDEK